MKIFLDTNVVLDWLLDRQDTFAEEASQIIKLAENKVVEAFISAGAVYTIVYVLKKKLKNDALVEAATVKILQILKVQSIDNQGYISACKKHFKDIEDAFQFETSLSINKIRFFVTANISDFDITAVTDPKIVTPRQVLAYLPVQ